MTGSRVRLVGLAVAAALLAGACGQAAPTPAPTAVPTIASSTAAPTVTASATPLPTASPAARSTQAPTPSPTVTPSHTPDPDQADATLALAAFEQLTGRAGLSFRYNQEAFVTLDDEPVGDATYILDVAGRDFAGVIKAGGQTIGLRYVKGKQYTRVGAGKWVKGVVLDRGAIDETLDPWRYLGPIGSLLFISRDPSNLDNFQYHNDGVIPYQTASMRQQGYEGSIDDLTLVLTPAGIPVSFLIHATADPTSGTLAGRHIDMVTTITVSRVGAKITIKAPK